MRAPELNKDDAISLFSVNSPGRPARLQGPPSRSMDRSHNSARFCGSGPLIANLHVEY